jgi:hypothetical protein
MHTTRHLAIAALKASLKSRGLNSLNRFRNSYPASTAGRRRAFSSSARAVAWRQRLRYSGRSGLSCSSDAIPGGRVCEAHRK